MAQQDIGFDLQFGVVGERQAQRAIEDIVRGLGSATSAAGGLGTILGSVGKLIEFGPAGLALGAMGTAMAVFGYKAQQAGENIRKVRYEIDMLSRVGPRSLTDADLTANQGALVSQFAKMGLEAGNTFTMSFDQRLGSWIQGAKAVNHDVWASIMNLGGYNIPSYEQSSKEGQDLINKATADNTEATIRINNEEKIQQRLAAIRRRAALATQELFALHYAPNSAGVGVMPEGYVGRQRQLAIRRESATATDTATGDRVDFLKAQLDKLVNSPTPLIAGTSEKLNMIDNAKRAADRTALEARLNAELDKQIQAKQEILQLDLEQRQIERDFIKAQNYGSWRAVGGGGHTIFDKLPGGGSIAEKIGLMGGAGRGIDKSTAKDVGYLTGADARHADGIGADAKTEITQASVAGEKVKLASEAMESAAVIIDGAADKIKDTFVSSGIGWLGSGDASKGNSMISLGASQAKKGVEVLFSGNLFKNFQDRLSDGIAKAVGGGSGQQSSKGSGINLSRGWEQTKKNLWKMFDDSPVEGRPDNGSGKQAAKAWDQMKKNLSPSHASFLHFDRHALTASYHSWRGRSVSDSPDSDWNGTGPLSRAQAYQSAFSAPAHRDLHGVMPLAGKWHPRTDAAYLAGGSVKRAVDMRGVTPWQDLQGRVNSAASPGHMSHEITHELMRQQTATLHAINKSMSKVGTPTLSS